MRFERIDLDRYGCFTGHTITLGLATSNSDFHIVYGPNEAGKSTLRDACIDFLYGFPNRTEYDFIHAPDILQVGAAVSTASAHYEARRIKRKSNNFLSLDGNLNSDAGLKAVLGDVSRAGFEQMFSLNDDSIEAGGEGILRSEGDLGVLLFSAASGLSSLSAGLKGIQAQADQFYKKSARILQLTQLKDELRDIEIRLQNSDVLVSAYVKLREDEASTRQRHADAKSERDGNAHRMDELQAILDAVDPWRELQKHERKLAPLADAPAVPEGWLAEAEGFVAAEASARRALDENRRAAERAGAKRDAIDIDETALEIARAVKRIIEDMLEARFRTSADIENRRHELRTIEGDIAALLKRLGRADEDDPQQFILPASARGQIRELLEQRSGLDAAEQSAREEWETAEERRKKAEGVVKQMGDVGDLTAFAQAIDAVRDNADGRSFDEISRQCATLEGELDESIGGLTPWRGDHAALMATRIPGDDDVQPLKREARDVEAARIKLDNEIERLKDEQVAVNAEIGSLGRRAGVVDDAEAQGVRAARDAAWILHRDGLDSDPPRTFVALRESANSFEVAMVEDDKVAAARLSLTSELADLRRAQTARAKCEAGLAHAMEKLEDLKRRETAHAEATVAFLIKLGLPSVVELNAIDMWLGRLEAARAKQRGFAKAAQRQAEAKTRYEDAISAVDSAMAGVGLTIDGLDWRAKLKRCDDTIADWHKNNRRKAVADDAYNDAVKESTRRQKAHQRSKGARAQWSASWSAALGTTWIGDAKPAAVKEVLREIDALTGKLEKANGLRGRIDAMTADRTAYRTEVKRLATVAGEAYDDSDPLSVADRLRARVAAAEEADRVRRGCEEELKNAEERLGAAQEEVDRFSRRIAEMRAVVSVESFEGLIGEMRRSEEKKRIESRIAQLQKTLQKGLKVASVAEAHAKFEKNVPDQDAFDAIHTEQDALARGKSDEDDHVTALFHEWKTAEGMLSTIGADDEAARLEVRRRTLLLEIERESHAFMRLSAGVMLVNEALRVYRETHRSSMMEKASDAFVRITRGAFRALAAAPGKNTEVLVGIRADGSSIVASKMSRGTRFQLYLALRIAGYEEFSKYRETLPFFADSVLEPFDDDRSGETFSLLHEMSKRGQVVYLTHHRHLCEIAKSVCGDGVAIHELPDLGISKAHAGTNPRHTRERSAGDHARTA